MTPISRIPALSPLASTKTLERDIVVVSKGAGIGNCVRNTRDLRFHVLRSISD